MKAPSYSVEQESVESHVHLSIPSDFSISGSFYSRKSQPSKSTKKQIFLFAHSSRDVHNSFRKKRQENLSTIVNTVRLRKD